MATISNVQLSQPATVSEQTPRQKLEIVVTEMQDKKILSSVTRVFEQLQEYHFAWSQGKNSAYYERLRPLLPQYYRQESSEFYLEPELAYIAVNLRVMQIAERLIQPSYTLETLREELRFNLDVTEQRVLEAGIRRGQEINPDSNSLDALTMSIHGQLTEPAFAEFLEHLEIQTNTSNSCIGSFFSKIWSVVAGFFSWLFCCGSSSTEDLSTLCDRLKIFSLRFRLQEGGVYQRLSGVANSITINRPTDEIMKIAKMLPPHLSENPTQHDYSALASSCTYYLPILTIALDIITHRVTKDSLADYGDSRRTKQFISSLISQCEDTNKTDLEKLTIGIYDQLEHEDFMKFVRSIYPNWPQD